MQKDKQCNWSPNGVKRRYPNFKKTWIIILLSLPGFLFSCTSLPKTSQTSSCTKIATGPGPEDIDLYQNQVIVSSHERREWKPGQILLHKSIPGPYITLERKGEPEGLFFSPHGISIEKSDKGDFLYVINHGRTNEDGVQSILIYKVVKDSLVFQKQIKSTLLTSPNDLVTDKNGGLFIINDSYSRGSVFEAAFSRRKARIVYCYIETEECKNVGRPIGLGNSAAINTKTKHLYVSTMFDEGLLRFSIDENNELHSEKVVYEAEILDNLYLQDDQIFFSQHPSTYSFIRHASSDSNEAPSIVSKYDLNSGKVFHLYANSGEEFSAASGAVLIENRLIISGVFSPFLLSCRLNEPS